MLESLRAVRRAVCSRQFLRSDAYSKLRQELSAVQRSAQLTVVLTWETMESSDGPP